MKAAWVILGASMVLGACSSTGTSSGPGVCEPGKQEQCACPGTDRHGVQVCRADGSGWEACLGCDVATSSTSSSSGMGGAGGAGSSSSSSSSTSSGEGGAMSGASSSSSTSSSTSSSSSSSTSSGCLDHLVISEIRTRGPNGGSDEFVEVYNPTGAVWSGELRGTSSAAGVIFAEVVTIQPGAFYAFKGPTFPGVLDANLSGGLGDTGYVMIYQGVPANGLIDIVCYCAMDNMSCDPAPGEPYCLGNAAADNWHDDTDGSNTPFSLARSSVCSDTGSSAIDFHAGAPTPGQ